MATESYKNEQRELSVSVRLGTSKRLWTVLMGKYPKWVSRTSFGWRTVANSDFGDLGNLGLGFDEANIFCNLTTKGALSENLRYLKIAACNKKSLFALSFLLIRT
ncbi:MAG: hypothetical protein SFX18_09230 [Pirellulales bacterium]|nr:hypothetical protein [Pirellulales bacterium]